jgi:hypothetical protein
MPFFQGRKGFDEFFSPKEWDFVLENTLGVFSNNYFFSSPCQSQE